MNDALFIENWNQLDTFTKKAFKDFARNPSASNQSYIVGYIGALADRGLLPEVPYWLALAGTIAEGNKAQDFVLKSSIYSTY